MTDTAALRDELARLCGWELEPGWVWRHKTLPFRPAACHPFPDNDLTALFAAIPSTANYSLSRTAEGLYEIRSGWPVEYAGDGWDLYAVLAEWLVKAMATRPTPTA